MQPSGDSTPLMQLQVATRPQKFELLFFQSTQSTLWSYQDTTTRLLIEGVPNTAADALSSLIQHQTPFMAFTDHISNGSGMLITSPPYTVVSCPFGIYSSSILRGRRHSYSHWGRHTDWQPGCIFLKYIRFKTDEDRRQTEWRKQRNEPSRTSSVQSTLSTRCWRQSTEHPQTSVR